MWAGYRNLIPRWRMIGLGMSGPLAPVFLFRDDFITAEAAPLTSPRTAEPGLGIARIIDVANEFSISTERLNYAAGAVKGFWELNGIAREAGLATVAHANFSVRHNCYFGFDNNAAGTSAAAGAIQARSVGRWDIFISGATFDVGIPLSTGTDYELFTIARAAGGFHLIKGGVLTDWTLVWVDDTEADPNLFATIIVGNVAVAGYSETMRVVQLPAPWNTDDGIATSTLDGVRSAGDTYTHEADFVGEFTVTTVPTVGAIFYSFRRQDANNYWEVIVEPNQDITLREVIASVPTARGTAAGVVNNGDRIVVIADGATIRVHDQNVPRITYALAANFQTETDGELLGIGDGVVSNIKLFPRVISGTALVALNSVVNA